MKKLLLTILFIVGCAGAHQSDNHGVTVGTFCGREITSDDLIQLLHDGAQTVHQVTINKAQRLKETIDQTKKQLEHLGRQKDAGRIGDAQYDLASKALLQQLEQANDELACHNKRTESIEDNADKIIMTGWQAMLDHQHEEQQRKTQVAIAGVNKTVENEGALERLQHLTAVATEPENLQKAGLFLTLTAAGITGGYYSLKLLYRYLETTIGKPPSLIEETSWQGILATAWNNMFGNVYDEAIFKDIILPESVETQLMRLAHITRQARQTNLPMRLLLLYGKPGTGKTMFAKMLAHYSGMHYAIVYGGRISTQNIDELKLVFDWSEQSDKGMILFIDEADAFLSNRDDLTPEQRKLVATFLALTGQSSNKIMVVMTCNRPGDMDSAALDRARTIHMPLPNNQEREKLLQLYFKKYITDDKRMIERNGTTQEIQIALDKDFNVDEALSQAADKLDGFSGRTIEQFVDELRAECYYSETCTLNNNIFETTLRQKLQEVTDRKEFIA